MPEENTGVFGEAAPETSPAQTTEPVETDQQPSSTDDGTSEQQTEEGKQIPYDRFKEVNESYRSTKGELEAAKARLAEIEGQREQTPEETPKFETAEDFLKYQDKNVDTKLNARDRMWEARIEATEKMNALKEAYPEVKEDAMFSEFLANKIRNNPGLDIMQAAKEVREHFAQYEERGRKKAESDFLKKGSFYGDVVANQPLQKTNEDKELVDSIVNAGGNKADGIF